MAHARRETIMKKIIVGMAAVLALTLGAVSAEAGLTKGPEVRVAGACTGPSTAKLKLKGEDGRIEVEFEVDQNRNGVRWDVTILQNGSRIAKVTRVTRAPSGSFEARVLASNTAGTDSFRARATRRSGEVCTARASL
jgi:hypothetical protein